VFIACAIVGAASCKASVKGEAKASGSVGGDDEEAVFDEPLEGPVRPEDEGFEPASSGASSGADEALIGARPDLHYKGPPMAQCRCLDVALGQANDPAFEWSTTPPRTNPDTQLVIAFSAAGKNCSDAPPGTLGPSYWGFAVEGENVIVVVEPSREGRPLMTGAIIPKPPGGGQVFVRASGAKAPYGRSLDGKEGRCRVGNPGPPRKSAPTPDEGGIRLREDEQEEGPVYYR
jgi:hypothetical protein